MVNLNQYGSISWEPLAPVIALHGCRGNMRLYYTSNRYYYHANNVSSQYLHIQSVPCVSTWISSHFTSVHRFMFVMNTASQSDVSSSVTISLSILYEGELNWRNSEDKIWLNFSLETWNLHEWQSEWGRRLSRTLKYVNCRMDYHGIWDTQL